MSAVSGTKKRKLDQRISESGEGDLRANASPLLAVKNEELKIIALYLGSMKNYSKFKYRLSKAMYRKVSSMEKHTLFWRQLTQMHYPGLDNLTMQLQDVCDYCIARKDLALANRQWREMLFRATRFIKHPVDLKILEVKKKLNSKGFVDVEYEKIKEFRDVFYSFRYGFERKNWFNMIFKKSVKLDVGMHRVVVSESLVEIGFAVRLVEQHTNVLCFETEYFLDPYKTSKFMFDPRTINRFVSMYSFPSVSLLGKFINFQYHSLIKTASNHPHAIADKSAHEQKITQFLMEYDLKLYIDNRLLSTDALEQIKST